MDFEAAMTAVLAGDIPVTAKKLGTFIFFWFTYKTFSVFRMNKLNFFGICRYLNLLLRWRHI
jgi:hypothetical protein